MPRLLALLLALSSASCGLLQPAARGRDLAQVLHVGIGASYRPGLYVWVLAPVLGTSLGYQPHAAYVGSDYGYTHAWHQAGYGMLVGGEMVRTEWGFSVDGFLDRPLWDAYLTGSQLMFMNLTVTDRRLGQDAQVISLRRLEAGLQLVFVSVSLGLDLAALGDFVAGWFGFDPDGDDDRETLHAPFPIPHHGRQADGAAPGPGDPAPADPTNEAPSGTTSTPHRPLGED